MKDSSYMSTLNAFATKLTQHTEEVTQSTKPLLCFGQLESVPSWPDQYINPPIRPHCYLPLRQTDIFGLSRTVTVQSNMSQARYIEPEHFLLRGGDWL